METAFTIHRNMQSRPIIVLVRTPDMKQAEFDNFCTVEHKQFTVAAIFRCGWPSACSLKTSRIFTMGNLSCDIGAHLLHVKRRDDI